MIRRAEAEDVDAVVALNVEVFGTQDGPGVRALLTGSLDVEWLVVAAGPDADRPGGGTLAAACARIPHHYDLDGVVLRGSQIENVTTDERFRRRGLVRSLFDTHHRRAAEDGELLQVIGGIPYFYRKLGYGYGFDVPPTISISAPSRAHDRHRPDLGAGGPTRRPRLDDRPGGHPTAGGAHRRAQPHRRSRHGSPGPPPPTAWRGSRSWWPRPGGGPRGWLRTVAWAEESQLFLLPGEAPDIDVARQLLAHAMDLGQRLADQIGRPLEVLASDSPGTPWSRAGAGRRPSPAPSPAATTSGYPTRSGCSRALRTGARPGASRRRAWPGITGSCCCRSTTAASSWHGRTDASPAIEAAAADPDPFDTGASGWHPTGSPPWCSGRWGASGLAARTDDTLLGDHATVMDVLFPARPNDVVADL